MIHPLVGSAYLGVPKPINISVALPTLHLFYCDSSLVGSAYLGVRHQDEFV
ncbi:hypothetical protein [Moorena sp. SIO4A5]|uniref:hypothetical protein n=1 Tax=Moorena sp. SIO4A5 TaxID=2607838 RepID=UPI0013C938DD|nr:hypothetical protein [Moorena sp. SIO4A5]NEO24885.1 hypothetical protein [Moorena sp. SIO4A5]